MLLNRAQALSMKAAAVVRRRQAQAILNKYPQLSQSTKKQFRRVIARTAPLELLIDSYLQRLPPE